MIIHGIVYAAPAWLLDIKCEKIHWAKYLQFHSFHRNSFALPWLEVLII